MPAGIIKNESRGISNQTGGKAVSKPCDQIMIAFFHELDRFQVSLLDSEFGNEIGPAVP